MTLSQQSAVSWQRQEQEPGFEAVPAGAQRCNAAETAAAAVFAPWQQSAELPGTSLRACGRGMSPSGRKALEQAFRPSSAPRAELRSLRAAAARGRCPQAALPLAGPGCRRNVPGPAGRCPGATGAQRARNPAAACPQPRLHCGNPGLPGSSTRALPTAGPAGPCATEPPGPAGTEGALRDLR